MIGGLLASEWRLCWTAVTLLTRFPAPRAIGFEQGWLARSASYFPLVGLIVGLCAAGAFRLARLLWPSAVGAVLALAVAAWVTGGLHEDGWADLFDGLAARGDRERFLAVMKDSRIGAVGALALILLIGVKVSALTALRPAEVPAALVAAHVLSRWSNVPLLWRLAYARPEGGMAGALAGEVTLGRVTAGTIAAALIVILALGWAALPAAAVAAAATGAAAIFFRARLGGITGDCLGATNQLVEVAVLLTLAARWPASS